MKKSTAALVSLALTLTALICMTGCESDPHDTHITTSVAAPR